MYVHCPECGGVVSVVNSLADSLVECSHCEKRFDPRDKETLPPKERAQKPELLPGLRAGDRLGGYVLQRVLGRGGMGTVLEATQLSLGRQVAIKVLAQDLAKDPQFVQRFDAEARLLAGLDHPNLVRVIDKGIEEKQLYLVMEKIDGVSLRDLLNERRLPSTDALKIIPPLCDALEYAHSQGVVHRDIKPENILVARDGTPKIADFGLARLVDTPQSRRITQSNMIMGTLDYMAPEQRERTKDADHRADIYALGVVLYEMLTGELPLGHFDPPSKKVELEIDLDDVILRVLSKDPGARYQHASDMGDVIRSRVSAVRGRGRARHARSARALLSEVPQRKAGLVFCGFAALFTVLLVTQALDGGPRDVQRSNALAAGLVAGLGILGALWFGLLERPLWPATWRRRRPGRFEVPKPVWNLVPALVLGWIFLPAPLGHLLTGLVLATVLGIVSESRRIFRFAGADDQPSNANAPPTTQPPKNEQPASAAPATPQPPKEKEMEIRIKDARGETQATVEIDADRRGRKHRREKRREKRRWWSRRQAPEPEAPPAVEVIAAEPVVEPAAPAKRRLSWMALLGVVAAFAAVLGATTLLAGEAFVRVDGYQLLDEWVRHDVFGLAALVVDGNPTAVWGASFWAVFLTLAALSALGLWNLLAFGHAARARGRRGRGLAVLALLLTGLAAAEVAGVADSPTADAIAEWRLRLDAPVVRLERKEGRVDFPGNPDTHQLAIDPWMGTRHRGRLRDLFDANLLARSATDDALSWLIRGTLPRRPLTSRAASVAALGEQLRGLRAAGAGTDKARARRRAWIERALGVSATDDPAPAIRQLAKAALDVGRSGHWPWQLVYGPSRGDTAGAEGAVWTVDTDGVVRRTGTVKSVDALDQRITLDLRDGSLRDAAETIVKQTSGLSFVVSPQIERLATGRLHFQRVRLRVALDALCAQLPARWTLKDGVVRITRGPIDQGWSPTPEKPLPREVR